tara:strand:- start:227 stop:1603 length:1377 start_codon:yes stop_codon:yes gene_type:complete
MAKKVETLDQLKAFRKTDLGKDILTQAFQYYGEHGTLKGFKIGRELGIVPRKKLRSSKIDIEKQKGIGLESEARRKGWQGKRDVTTAIPEDEVKALAKKYNQPDSVVKEFLEDQKLAKKNLEKLIDKINTRIGRDNPELLEKYKASLGHGKAASRWEHSADVKSNIELEEFFTNVSRSNKDEISDLFNRSLGRSIDLEEEFLKHLNPELRDFAPNMSRVQKDQLIKKVRKGMDDPNLKWEGDIADGTNKPLFKSKEEFLINRELQGLRDASGNLAMDKPLVKPIDPNASKVSKAGQIASDLAKNTGKFAKTAAGLGTAEATVMLASGQVIPGTLALAMQTPAVQKKIAGLLAKQGLKLIPGLSFGSGVIQGAGYALSGQPAKALLSVAGGAIGEIPGIGDAAQAAIDLGLTIDDVKQAKKAKADEPEITNVKKKNNLRLPDASDINSRSLLRSATKSF